MLYTLEQRRLNYERSLADLLNDPQALTGYYYYQKDALKAVQSKTQKRATRTYVRMPTSSGKTEVMLGAVSGLSQQAQKDNYIPRMFLTEPTQLLVTQTRDRLLERFPEIPVGVYYSDEKELEQALTIITPESLYTLLINGTVKPNEVDYLFLDEAHRLLTDDRRRDLLKPFYDTTVITGFTATDRFNELKALYRTLGEEAYSIDYATLIKQGYIAQRASVIVNMPVPKTPVPTNSKLSAKELAECEAVRDILLDYRDDHEGGERIIGDQNMIFKWRIEEIIHQTDLLNNDPRIRAEMIKATGNPDIIPAVAIYGGMSPTQRKRIIADFDAGKVKNLVGAKVNIEGVDTKARNVLTPERESTLQMEQVGGRVRDKTNLCRVITICEENSGKKKPAFYSKAIGAARITKDGEEYGLSRSMETLRLSHPRIGNNLSIYNSPDEVASYEKSREPKPKSKGTLYEYKGLAGMRPMLRAWKPELQYIYKLLYAQHLQLPKQEKYCNLAGALFPREYLMSLAEGQVAIQTKAVEILEDMIGGYSEESDVTVSWSDIESDLISEGQVRDPEWISGAKQTFIDMERAYATALFAWKYGSLEAPYERTSLPRTIRVGRLEIPFEHAGVFLQGDTFIFGIHEENLRDIWQKDRKPRPDDYLYKSGFSKLVQIPNSDRWYSDLWEEIRRAHMRHPFAQVEIDGHIVNCDTFLGRRNTSKNRLCLNASEAVWVKEKRQERIKTEELLSKEEFSALIRVDIRKPSFALLWDQARDLCGNQARATIEIDGHKIKCGKVRADRPESNPHFCISRSEATWFREQIKKPPPSWKPIAYLTSIYFGQSEKITEAVHGYKNFLITEEVNRLQQENSSLSEEEVRGSAEQNIMRTSMGEFELGFYINPSLIELMERQGVVVRRDNLRIKKGHLLARTDMMEELNTSFAKTDAIYNALEAAYKKTSSDRRYVPINVTIHKGRNETSLKVRIPRSLLGYAVSHNTTTFCVDKRATSLLKSALPPGKTCNDWGYEEAGVFLHLSPEESVSPIYKALETAYNDDNQKQILEVRGIAGGNKCAERLFHIRIPRAELKYCQKRNVTAFTMTERAARLLIERALGVAPIKKSHELSYEEAAKILKVNAQHYTRPIYRALETAWLDSENIENEFIEAEAIVNQRKKRTILVKVPRVSINYRRSTYHGGPTFLTIDQSAITPENFGMLPLKTSKDLGLNQMAEQMGVAPATLAPLYRMLKQEWEKSKHDQPSIAVDIRAKRRAIHLEIEKELIGEKRLEDGGPSHFCCDASLAKIFTKAFGQGWLVQRKTETGPHITSQRPEP
jgi:superfamily II DNA or RNA helicase